MATIVFWSAFVSGNTVKITPHYATAQTMAGAAELIAFGTAVKTH